MIDSFKAITICTKIIITITIINKAIITLVITKALHTIITDNLNPPILIKEAMDMDIIE